MTSDAIPDFSATPRAQVPEAFKWRIEDIFPDEPAWRAGFAQAQDLAASLDPLARVWTASPAAMGDFMERLEQVNKLGGKLANYASLQADMDLGDTRYQAMKGEVQSFLVDLGAKLAFMEPDLLALGEAQGGGLHPGRARAWRPTGWASCRILRMKDAYPARRGGAGGGHRRAVRPRAPRRRRHAHRPGHAPAGSDPVHRREGAA